MTKTQFSKILGVLKRLEIPFVLAGAHAVAAWGVVRSTRDIDLIAKAGGESAGKLAAGLRKAGFKAILEKGDEQDPVLGVIHVESPGPEASEPVDIILGIRRMPMRLFIRSSALDFYGLKIPVISPEDLIVLKCLAGGPIDMEDAGSILAIMKGRLDKKYLESELKRCRISLQKLIR